MTVEVARETRDLVRDREVQYVFMSQKPLTSMYRPRLKLRQVVGGRRAPQTLYKCDSWVATRRVQFMTGSEDDITRLHEALITF